jgi:hypothetical protein
MWSEAQLDELSSGCVLRALVNPSLFSLVCRVNWWTLRAGWMWSEPQQDQLFSGGAWRFLINPWLFSVVCRVNL